MFICWLSFGPPYWPPPLGFRGKRYPRLNLPLLFQKCLEENIHFWESLLAAAGRIQGESEFDYVDMKPDGHSHIYPVRPLVVCQVLRLPLVPLFSFKWLPPAV